MRPLPDVKHPDFAPFWEACRRHDMQLPMCGACHLHFWPPRPVCPRCRSGSWQWEGHEGTGLVFSWTVVHRTTLPGFAEMVPYAIAVVQLDGPATLRLLGRWVDDIASLHIGLRARVTFEELGEEVALPVWSRLR